MLHVYSGRDERSHARRGSDENVNPTCFHPSLSQKASQCQLSPGIAGFLNLEMHALTGAAACRLLLCQELRHLDAAYPLPSSGGSISSPSLVVHFSLMDVMPASQQPHLFRVQPCPCFVCFFSWQQTSCREGFHPHTLPDNSLEPASVCLEAQLLAAS